MKASIYILSISLFALLLLSGCMEDMESVSQITKFRVMGLQAEPPEINAGSGTTLEVLFADPQGAGREISVLWLTCVGSLTTGSDVDEGCEPIWLPQLETVENNGHIYNIPTTPVDILDDLIDAANVDLEDNLKPEDVSLSVTVIAVLCAGGDLEAGLEADGEDVPEGEISSLDEMCQGGDGLVAIKTFDITVSETPNQNPVIDSFFFDGIAPEDEVAAEQDQDGGVEDSGVSDVGLYECVDAQGCRQGTSVDVYLTKESFEIYGKVPIGESEPVPTVESPYISWFVAGVSPVDVTGTFNADQIRIIVPDDPADYPDWVPESFSVNWVPPRDGGLFRMWAVVHDPRGGMTWESYLVEALVPEL